MLSRTDRRSVSAVQFLPQLLDELKDAIRILVIAHWNLDVVENRLNLFGTQLWEQIRS